MLAGIHSIQVCLAPRGRNLIEVACEQLLAGTSNGHVSWNADANLLALLDAVRLIHWTVLAYCLGDCELSTLYNRFAGSSYASVISFAHTLLSADTSGALDLCLFKGRANDGCFALVIDGDCSRFTHTNLFAVVVAVLGT